LTEEKDVK